tara:strand:+ start:2716 stop:3474 length:759 start_codon:yes stop_codon:yes gene_type:complete
MKKTILIIGGSGLIGKPLVRGYLKDKKVINLDIKNFKLIDKNYYYEKIDLNKLGTIKSKIDNIFKKYKNINSVINCSYPTGKSWGKCSFEKLNLNLLNKNLYSNLHSYIWSSCLVLQNMKRKKISGSLILFSSIYGMRGQDMSIYENTEIKENIIYAVSKGGISNFVREAASYYGKYKIRVNAICPGGISGHVKGSKNSQSQVFKNNYLKRVPIKRFANTNDITAATIFLSSDKASYITGINLLIDGGWTSI